MDEIINNKKFISNQVGVYFILNKDNDVIYVGQTKSLYARLATHYRNMSDFDSYSFIEVSLPNYLKLVESYFINKFKPKYNSEKSYQTNYFFNKNDELSDSTRDYLNKTFSLENLKRTDLLISVEFDKIIEYLKESKTKKSVMCNYFLDMEEITVKDLIKRLQSVKDKNAKVIFNNV